MIEIIDEKTRNLINFVLHNTVYKEIKSKLPFQNYINIDKQNLFKLKRYNYYYYIKDIIKNKRAILLNYIDSEYKNKSVLISKDTIYEINLKVIDEYYSGTVFDVSYDPEGNITIYDVLTVSSNNKTKYSFIDRINEAVIYCNNIIHTDKKVNTVDYHDSISKFCLNENEEFFMVPNDLYLVFGINYSAFKWKPTELITFSLLVKIENENLELYTMNFKNLKKFCIIHKKIPEGENLINKITQLEDFKNECIVDFNIKDNEFVPIKVNNEKLYPNNLRSIEKLVQIKNENLSYEELMENIN